MGTKYDLSLIIRAVDKATEPLRKVNERMRAFTAPVRKLNNSMVALSAEAGIPRLAKGFAGVGSAIANVGKEARALALKLGAMAAGGAFALYRIVRGAVDAGDELATMAQRVGLSADAYAQYQFAAAQADVEQEQFNGAMDQFNKRLGEAKAGQGELLTFLQKVAPRLALQVKGAKSTEEAMALMTGAFEAVKDPARRAALSNAAFGRSGLQMGQFLGQGSKAIEEQRRRYLELAGSQERFAAGAGELDNAMRETGMAFLGARNAVAAEFFPALVKLSKAVAEFLGKHRDALVAWARRAAKAISDWVDSGGFQRLIATLERWGRNIGDVVSALGGFKTVAAVVAAFMAGPLLISLGGLVSSLYSLGAALLATPIGWFLGALALLGVAAYMIYKNWKYFKLFWQFNIVDPLTSAAEAIQGAWSSIGEFFTNLWQGIVSTVTGAWEKIKPVVDAIQEVLSWTTPTGLAAKATTWAMDRVAGGGGKGGEARVQVDFTGMPRGTRVSSDPGSTAAVDLSMGYALVGD